MSDHVYITRLSKFLPNNVVTNDEMESYLGMINDKPSISRRLVLRNNGICQRYYALDKNGQTTHTNTIMTADCIRNLIDDDFKIEDIELISCGTTSPDQILPSHASMVHGLIKGRNIETASFTGACNSGMHALKYGYLSVLSGNTQNAVCTGSERISKLLMSKHFQKESENLIRLEQNPYVAFEKEFLRWMLSDGAGAALLENKPGKDKSLRIEWIENCSFANEVEACMYAGAEKNIDGELKGWQEFDSQEWLDFSIFTFKQDIKLLSNYIISFGIRFFLQLVRGKRMLDVNKLDYFLPHLSSELFRNKIVEELAKYDLIIPQEKWFTNLAQVGNVGAASPYLILEELFNKKELIKGQKILMMVPESARFSYTYLLLTVC